MDMNVVNARKTEDYKYNQALESQRFYSRLDSLYFVDNVHKQAFMDLLKKFDKAWNHEYASAFYLLTIDKEIRSKALQYIDKEGIDFNEMLYLQDFSSGYHLLVSIAYSLFNWIHADKVCLSDVACMSQDFYPCVISALKIRRGQLPMGQLESLSHKV